MMVRTCICQGTMSGGVVYCPVHKTAPLMLEALVKAERIIAYVVLNGWDEAPGVMSAVPNETEVRDEVRVAIKAARGE